MKSEPIAAWYLLHTKPKQEGRAKEHLENQGVVCFLPQIEMEKVVRGKRKTVLEALFPNYIFAYLDDQSIGWSSIRSTRGVRDFVKFGLQLARVPEIVVTSLQKRVKGGDSSLSLDLSHSAPKKGDSVSILEGAFKDLNGIFQRAQGEERSIILLTILNKTTEIEVDNRAVTKID